MRQQILRGVIVLGCLFILVGLGTVAWVRSSPGQYSNGPVSNVKGNEPECGDYPEPPNEVTHKSKVYYDYSADPHRFTVRQVDYWGRVPDSDFWIQERYRHEQTLYKEWTGSTWETVMNIAPSSWRNEGSRCNNLGDKHSIGYTVELDGGGLVKQRLKYKYECGPNNDGCQEPISWYGWWNYHWLQDP